MPIQVHCACGKAPSVKDELAGRKIRCPACAAVLTVPYPIIEIIDEDQALEVLLEEMPDEQAGTPILLPLDAPARRPVDLRKPRSIKKRIKHDSSSPMIAVHPSIWAGLAMMAGAVVWFFVGLASGWIYFYPPVLFVLGIASVVRGFTGAE